MANKTHELIATLKQIKSLAEGALHNATALGSNRKTIKKESPKKQSSREKLPVHILHLRDSGFFGQPKTAHETHAKLQTSYACDLNRVAVVLLRLRARGKLRKTSKIVSKKKQVAYVW